MAIDNTVGMWNENAGTVYNAREYRRWLSRMMAYDLSATPGTGSGGIFRPQDFAVSAGGGQSVNVASGGVYVEGTESLTQGGYFVYSDAIVNVVLTAADATNPRKDLIGVQTRDSEYSGATDDARILVITGTPAASPAEPTPPDNFVTLALVDVPANDNTVNAGQIVDRRRMMAALGGIAICTSTTRPSVNLFEGLWIYETDTHALKQYTTPTTGWTPPWNVSWGVMAMVEGTANVAGNGAAQTIIQAPSLPVVANRSIKLTYSTRCVKTDTPGNIGTWLLVRGVTELHRWVTDYRGGGSGFNILLERHKVVSNTPAGSHVFSVQWGSDASVFEIDVAEVTQPRILTIEDGSSSGSPA